MKLSIQVCVNLLSVKCNVRRNLAFLRLMIKMNCSIPVCADIDINPLSPVTTINDSFSARLEEDVACLLTHIVCIQDNLILVDNENKKLKRFTTSKEYVDNLKLDDPCGVAILKLSSHIVVTEPTPRLLSFVSIGEDINLSSRRKTDKRYQSICCVDETRLVAGCCDLSESSVDVLDYMGVVLMTINSILSKSIVFRTPASIACTSNSTVIVSDSGLCKVVGIGLDGSLTFVHDPQCIPSGITVDKNDVLYLCCYDKKCVQCLKYENKQIFQTYSNYSIKCPLAVTCSKNHLYVTEEMPCDSVSIIKLKNEEWRPDKPVHLSNIHVTVLNTDCGPKQ